MEVNPCNCVNLYQCRKSHKSFLRCTCVQSLHITHWIFWSEGLFVNICISSSLLPYFLPFLSIFFISKYTQILAPNVHLLHLWRAKFLSFLFYQCILVFIFSSECILSSLFGQHIHGCLIPTKWRKYYKISWMGKISEKMTTWWPLACDMEGNVPALRPELPVQMRRLPAKVNIYI
jgi:hypothetical protein